MPGVALLEGAALLVGEDALFIEERCFANCYFGCQHFVGVVVRRPTDRPTDEGDDPLGLGLVCL